MKKNLTNIILIFLINNLLSYDNNKINIEKELFEIRNLKEQIQLELKKNNNEKMKHFYENSEKSLQGVINQINLLEIDSHSLLWTPETIIELRNIKECFLYDIPNDNNSFFAKKIGLDDINYITNRSLKLSLWLPIHLKNLLLKCSLLKGYEHIKQDIDKEKKNVFKLVDDIKTYFDKKENKIYENLSFLSINLSYLILGIISGKLLVNNLTNNDSTKNTNWIQRTTKFIITAITSAYLVYLPFLIRNNFTKNKTV